MLVLEDGVLESHCMTMRKEGWKPFYGPYGKNTGEHGGEHCLRNAGEHMVYFEEGVLEVC